MGDKRFTDVKKWVDPWFGELSPEHKLFWNYLCDTCDQAGVWNQSKKMTRGILCLPDFDFDKALEAYGDRIKVLPGGEWWLVKFVEFQNPRGLQEGSNYHAPVFKSAEKYGLNFQHLLKGSSTHDKPMTKGPSRDQDKDKDKDKALADFKIFYEAYPKKVAKGAALKAWLKQKPPLQAVLTSLSAQMKAATWPTEAQYVKHPATWLNSLCWEDEVYNVPVTRKNVL